MAEEQVETRSAYALVTYHDGQNDYEAGDEVTVPYNTDEQKQDAHRLVLHGVLSWEKPQQDEESPVKQGRRNG